MVPIFVYLLNNSSIGSDKVRQDEVGILVFENGKLSEVEVPGLDLPIKLLKSLLIVNFRSLIIKRGGDEKKFAIPVTACFQ